MLQSTFSTCSGILVFVERNKLNEDLSLKTVIAAIHSVASVHAKTIKKLLNNQKTTDIPPKSNRLKPSKTIYYIIFAWYLIETPTD